MALPRFVQDFKVDFNQFLLKELEPFAFVRFHDGEFHVLEQLDYKAQSGWNTHGNQTWISLPLRESLQYVDPGYYYGISSPCDFPRGASYYREELSLVKAARARMTFSSIFANSNFVNVPLLERRFPDAVLVGCTNKCDIVVPADGINKIWDIDGAIAKMREVEGRPIFVAAGPCTNVMIHRYWMTQPPERRVIVLDIGSAFDRKIHGKATRPYQNHRTAHVCNWNSWAAWTPLPQSRRDQASKRGQLVNRLSRMSAEDLARPAGTASNPRERHASLAKQKPSGEVMVRVVPKFGPDRNTNVKVVKVVKK
jgi:hypothetical protein